MKILLVGPCTPEDLSEKAPKSRDDYKQRFLPARGVREYVEVYE